MNIQLLRKYFNHETDPVENRKVKDWLLNNHDHPLLAQFFAAHWNQVDESAKWDSENSWQQFQTRFNVPKQTKRIIGRPIIAGEAIWLKIAAVFIVIFAAALFILHLSNNSLEVVPQIVKQIHKDTEKGQKLTVFLKDGSKIILNSASSISYPEVFSDSCRLVKLNGEAFFEIAKNPDQPFLVQAGDVEVRVLGTSFNVNHSNEAVEVALVSGQVQLDPDLNNSGEQIILNPGEAANVNLASHHFITNKFDILEKTGWKEGKLIFQKARVEEIFHRLELWYGVNFELENQHLINDKLHYSGEFQNESLQNVLESIGFSKDFNFEITKEKVKIIFKSK